MGDAAVSIISGMPFLSSSFSSSTSSSMGVKASVIGGTSGGVAQRFIVGAMKLVRADNPKNAPAM